MKRALTFVSLLLVVEVAGTAGCGGTAHVAPPPAIVDDAELAAKIDPIAADLLAKVPASAITIGVAKDDRLVFAKGYGLADREHQVAANAATVYRIGSVTKQFTSALVMQLVEQGKIALDDPISKYLPDYPEVGRAITIRQLLTHTSGLYNYTDEPFMKDVARVHSLPDLLALFDGKPLDFAPGERWSYSNSNYVVLGAILEKLTGQTYQQLVDERIIRKLHLPSTRYCPDAPARPDEALGYSVDEKDKSIKASEPISMTNAYAAGALCSTVGDLARWTAALHGGEVVSPASYLAMTTPVTIAGGKTAPYGFGLGTGDLGGHKTVWHNGGINGFNSSVTYYVDDRVTVVVLINSDAGGADDAGARVARAVIGIAEPVVKDEALSEADAQPYLGRYKFEEVRGLVIEVTYADGHLVAQPEGQPALPLHHQGGGVFLPDGHPEIKLSFSGDTLTVEQNGLSFSGQRQ